MADTALNTLQRKRKTENTQSHKISGKERKQERAAAGLPEGWQDSTPAAMRWF